MLTEQELRRLFGKRLRQLREGKEWTREELATIAQISPNYIYYLERGERSVSLKMLANLSNAFDIPAQSLFDFSALPEDL